MKKKIYWLLGSLLALPVIVQAQPNPDTGGDVNSLEDLFDKFTVIVNYVFGVALGVAIILIIWSGIAWITAGGDDAAVKKARQNLLYGVIGVMIILGAWVLIRVVASFLGVSPPSGIFGF